MKKGIFSLLCISLLVVAPGCKKCCGTKTTHEKKYKKLHKSSDTRSHDMAEDSVEESDKD